MGTLCIQEIIDRIKKQQLEMGYTDYISQSQEARMAYLRSISLAMIVEVVEMLQEMPWKPWVAIEDQPNNPARAEKEAVDIFVFMIDAILIINPQIELEGAILAVLQKIDDRIKNGYGKQE